MIRAFITAVALGSVTLCTGGCLVVGGSSIEESGVKISAPTLEQVKPGETTEAWLLATAGEPTCRRSVDDRTSILRYDHTVTTASGGAVFLLFAGERRKEERTSTVLEVIYGFV